MDWQARMNRALDLIEAHLKGRIDWQDAAREANCSTFHFLRMFQVILDCSPGEYVRRRRLSQAAMDLAASDAKVIDIALDYGYDSPDAFAKAFKKLFDLNPSEVQRGGKPIRLFPRISFSIILKGTEAMDYRIEKQESFNLTGISLRTRNDDGSNFRDISGFWDQIMADGRFAALTAKVLPGSKIGVAGVCSSEDMDSPWFDYWVACETPAARAGLPEGCRDLRIPAATWAVFPSRGPLPGAIRDLWKRIYSEWFPSSGYEHDLAPSLELYGQGDPQAPDYHCEVWIPIRKVS